jgi:hypothetical protein
MTLAATAEHNGTVLIVDEFQVTVVLSDESEVKLQCTSYKLGCKHLIKENERCGIPVVKPASCITN